MKKNKLYPITSWLKKEEKKQLNEEKNEAMVF